MTLVGAGNIATCTSTGDDATRALLDSIPGTVFADGDAAYDKGALTQYNTCYNPSWGRHKARTLPAAGELDYKTANAAGYFGYFGAAAGDPKQGYYSYDLGAWHIVVLNTGSSSLVPFTATSAQVQWLKADLAAHPAHCTLAYWHNPLFDSKDAPNNNIRPLWDALYAGGVDVVVNAHYAFYERFAPQTPAGVADPVLGIREFVVGTGGAAVGAFGTVRPNSQVRSSGTFGVLKLTLDDARYSWQFVPVAGKTFSDSGSTSCHGAPPTVNAGPDLTSNPGDTVNLSATISDPDPTDAPWAYTINWGDNTSTTGSTTTQTAPLTVPHVYAALGTYSARVSVTNSGGGSDVDTAAVKVVAPNVLVGAGDIADCAKTGDSLTANLMDTIPGTVFAAGDNAYPNGASSDYKNCYNPTWGRFKSRTKPVPGNHDYLTAGAAGYFNYFGAAGGDPAKGYYSFDIGSDWHLIALNSQCSHAGGCGSGTAQYTWLQSDLATHAGECILAYWHIPLFSSGGRAASNSHPFWNLLYAAHADVILNGHDHIYERFAPQDPSGNFDSANGIPEFIVGTGGANHTSLVAIAPNSVVHDTTTFGVLEMTLHQGSYNWQFVPAAGNGTFTDSGWATCHANAGTDTTPPSVPSGLTATPAGTSEIDLSWTASTDNPGGSGVAGYKIYRSDHGSTPLTTATGTSYADVGLSPATTYTYTVTAFDQAGNESAQSQPVSATTLSSGGTQTLNPIADSWVNSAAPTTNYGSSTSLYVDADGVRQTYLKFDLTGLSGTVSSVTLKLYAGSSQSTGYKVYSVADTSWSESAITWNTKPPLASTSSGSSGPVTSGTWTSVMLPGSLVQAALGGKLSLGLQTASNTNLKLLSRESSTPPQLLVSTT